ncbi:MAG: hypothetical protein ACRECV_08310 [Xanthobacteraceae bacterium]
MPHSRIVAASASFLLLLAAALTSAAAQSAAGQPMPLLQFVHHRSLIHHRHKVSSAKLRPHRRFAEKLRRKGPIKRRIAKRVFSKPHHAIAVARRAPVPIQTTASALPQNVWPTANLSTAATTATPPRGQAPGAVTMEAVVDTDPNQIVTGNHSVQAALPNGLANVTSSPVRSPIKKVATITAATPAAAKPAVHAMMVKAVPSDAQSSGVGSASWIAHMLAALGGAIAAGAVAWFLIRPAPEKNYG